MKRAITGIVAASLTLGTMAPAAFAATTSAPSYFGNQIHVGSYNANVQALKVQDAGNTTALFPFYYIQAGLQSLGYSVTWDGVAKRLDITTPDGVTLDKSNLNPGVGAAGIYINGTLVQRAPFSVANDKGGNNKPTSFMAAYYLNQALARVGFTNSYDGTGAGWTLTAPVAKFGVQSVTALNGGQLLVKFTKPVDSTSAVAAGNYSLYDGSGTPVAFGTPELQADGQSVIIPLSTAVPSTTSDDITVSVANVTLDGDAKTMIPTYSTVVHVADTTAPTITSVTASTNGSAAGTATISFSEPIKAGAAIKVDGAYVTATVLGDSMSISTTLDASKSHTVQIVNLTDASGNVNPVASATFNVTVDKTIPAVTSVVAKGDNGILVTFSKKVTLASVQTAIPNGNLKSETFGSVATGSAQVVTSGATTSDTQFYIPVTDPGLFNSLQTSRNLTLVIGSGVTDTLGNATTVATTSAVSFKEDTTAPAVTGITYDTNSDGTVHDIVLHVSKGVAAGSVTTSGIRVIDPTGVDITTTPAPGFLSGSSVAANAGDTSIKVNLQNTSSSLSGVYTFYVPANMITDQSFLGNKNAAATFTVDFGAAQAGSISVAGASASSNTITVDYGTGHAVKGGAVAGSATNPAAYTINGSALPVGTVITLSANYEYAYIALPANSVATTDTASVFTVNGVQTTAGGTVKPFTGTVSLTDNTAPTLTGAVENADNSISLSFSEPVVLLQPADLAVSVNGATAMSSSNYTVAPGSGADAGKWVLTFGTGHVPANGSTVTVTTKSNATGHDAALNPVAAGGSASVTEGTLSAANAAAVVAADKAALAVGYTSPDTSSSVKSILTLPTSGANGSTITWSSDNAAVSSNGTVTRPIYSAGDATVNLTATISYGSATDTKVFPVTVVKKSFTLAAHTPSADNTFSFVGDGYTASDFAVGNIDMDSVTTGVQNSVTVNGLTYTVSYSAGVATVTVTGTATATATATTQTITVTKDGQSQTMTLNIPAVTAGDLASTVTVTIS